MSSDDDEIAKYLAQKGATKLPPKPAAVLGESTPGWRRNAERKSEHQSDKGRARHQKALRTRAGFTGEGDEKTKE